jgi:hypothetical protein
MFHGEVISSPIQKTILVFSFALLALASPARAETARAASAAAQVQEKIDALQTEVAKKYEDSKVTCSPARIASMGRMADDAHRAFAACVSSGSACSPKLKRDLIDAMVGFMAYLRERRQPCPAATDELWRFINRVNIPRGAEEQALIQIADQMKKTAAEGQIDPAAARDSVEIAFRLQDPETRRRFLLQIEALKREGKQVPTALERAVTDNQNVPQALLEAGRAYMALAFDFTRELDYQTRMQSDFSGLIRILFVRRGTASGMEPQRTRTFENAIKELLTAETGNGIEPPLSSADDAGALKAVCSCRDSTQNGRCVAVLKIDLAAEEKLVAANAHLIFNDQELGKGCAAGQLAQPSQDKTAAVKFETCAGQEPACLAQIESAAAMLRSLRFSVLGSLPFLGRNREIEYLGEPLDPSTKLNDLGIPKRQDAPERLATRPGLQVLPGSGPCAGKFRTGLVDRLLASYEGEIGHVSAGPTDPPGQPARLLIDGDGKTCKAVLWHNDSRAVTTSTLGVRLYGVSATAIGQDGELGEEAGRSAARAIGEFYRDAFHVHWQPPRCRETNENRCDSDGPHPPAPKRLSMARAGLDAALFSGVPWLVDRDASNDGAGIVFGVLETAAIIAGATFVLESVHQRNAFAANNVDDMSGPAAATRSLRMGLGTILIGIPVIRLASWLTYLARREKS